MSIRIVFDADGYHMAIAPGIDLDEYTASIGGTVVDMIGEPPTLQHQPRMDGTWWIPDEVLFAEGLERETKWLADEMSLIAEQLLMIEDGDPNALPGTDRQWRDYRIRLRSWKEGAEHFPDQAYRPARPD